MSMAIAGITARDVRLLHHEPNFIYFPAPPPAAPARFHLSGRVSDRNASGANIIESQMPIVRAIKSQAIEKKTKAATRFTTPPTRAKIV